jgi:CrcB protein
LRPRISDAAWLYAAVALGSVIGSLLRALASIAFIVFFGLGTGFPVATLIVNVVGSFVIGFYATLTGPDGRVFAGPRHRHFVMTGICGGFTTFSMFSLETLHLAREGQLSVAGANVGISVLAWLTAVFIGHALALRLNRLKGARQ